MSAFRPIATNDKLLLVTDRVGAAKKPTVQIHTRYNGAGAAYVGVCPNDRTSAIFL
jgi:hypothetical protein